MRILLLLIFVLSTCYSAVFAADEMACSTKVEISSSHGSHDNTSDSVPMSHNDQSCVGNHCHLGHCAVLVKENVQAFTLNETLDLTFKSLLFPIDFVLEILRPPIA